jgi:hypothetical protein
VTVPRTWRTKPANHLLTAPHAFCHIYRNRMQGLFKQVAEKHVHVRCTSRPSNMHSIMHVKAAARVRSSAHWAAGLTAAPLLEMLKGRHARHMQDVAAAQQGHALSLTLCCQWRQAYSTPCFGTLASSADHLLPVYSYCLDDHASTVARRCSLACCSSMSLLSAICSLYRSSTCCSCCCQGCLLPLRGAMLLAALRV